MRYLLSLMVLQAFLACHQPDDECACTEFACFNGVRVLLTGNPDSAVFSDFSVAIAHGDTLEPAGHAWEDKRKDSFFFSSRTLVGKTPARIGIRVAYRENGVDKTLTRDSDLAWTSLVCNQCSGGPSCRDEMAHRADVTLHLGTLIR